MSGKHSFLPSLRPPAGRPIPLWGELDVAQVHVRRGVVLARRRGRRRLRGLGVGRGAVLVPVHVPGMQCTIE